MAKNFSKNLKSWYYGLMLIVLSGASMGPLQAVSSAGAQLRDAIAQYSTTKSADDAAVLLDLYTDLTGSRAASRTETMRFENQLKKAGITVAALRAASRTGGGVSGSTPAPTGSFAADTARIATLSAELASKLRDLADAEAAAKLRLTVVAAYEELSNVYQVISLSAKNATDKESFIKEADALRVELRRAADATQVDAILDKVKALYVRVTKSVATGPSATVAIVLTALSAQADELRKLFEITADAAINDDIMTSNIGIRIAQINKEFTYLQTGKKDKDGAVLGTNISGEASFKDSALLTDIPKLINDAKLLYVYAELLVKNRSSYQKGTVGTMTGVPAVSAAEATSARVRLDKYFNGILFVFGNKVAVDLKSATDKTAAKAALFAVMPADLAPKDKSYFTVELGSVTNPPKPSMATPPVDQVKQTEQLALAILVEIVKAAKEGTDLKTVKARIAAETASSIANYKNNKDGFGKKVDAAQQPAFKAEYERLKAIGKAVSSIGDYAEKLVAERKKYCNGTAGTVTGSPNMMVLVAAIGDTSSEMTQINDQYKSLQNYFENTLYEYGQAFKKAKKAGAFTALYTKAQNDSALSKVDQTEILKIIAATLIDDVSDITNLALVGKGLDALERIQALAESGSRLTEAAIEELSDALDTIEISADKAMKDTIRVMRSKTLPAIKENSKAVSGLKPAASGGVPKTLAEIEAGISPAGLKADEIQAVIDSYKASGVNLAARKRLVALLDHLNTDGKLKKAELEAAIKALADKPLPIPTGPTSGAKTVEQLKAEIIAMVNTLGEDDSADTLKAANTLLAVAKAAGVPLESIGYLESALNAFNA